MDLLSTPAGMKLVKDFLGQISVTSRSTLRACLQPFGPKRHTSAVVPEDFYQIPLPPEHVEGPACGSRPSDC